MNWKLIRIIDFCFGIVLICYFRCVSISTQRTPRQRGISDFRRILLIKFWGIGNIFMLLPTIQAIQETWPEAAIDFLTLESNREALTMTGAVHEIVTIDTKSTFTFLRTWFHATKQLRRIRYDLIIDFEQFARFSALMTYQIRAPLTIGFKTRGQHRHHLYASAIYYDNDIHITRSFYALATEAGITRPFSPIVQLKSLETLRSKGKNLLKKYGIVPDVPIVIMHIGTSDNFKERRWPPQHYAVLADLLTGRFGMHVILTGLQDEAYLIAETMKYLKFTKKVSDLGGQLSFADYYALITAADLVISADTAAVHLGSAVNTPVVGLYGPNTPHLYGPWGTNGLALTAGFDCSPCITNFNSKINTCRHPDGSGACMAALSVEKVFTAIGKSYCAPHAPFRTAKTAGRGL